MKFVVTAGEGLPVGSYPAKFAAAEPFENEYGPAVKLVFEVLQGEFQGQSASRICSVKLSPKSNLFRFIAALKGTKLEPGEEVNLLSFIGQKGMMTVEQADSGSSRVGSFIRVD